MNASRRSMLGRVLSGVRRMPLLRHANERRKLNQFLSRGGYGTHWGEFESFDAARAWLPKTPEFALDAHSDHYLDVRTGRVYGFDYPVIFWLRQAFESGARTLFDIGGSVGVHFYAYRKYLDYPEGLDWLVSDLPHVVKRGRDYAQHRGAQGLAFVDRLDTRGVERDIWVAAGVLEFIEGVTLEGLLDAAAHPPAHLLVNKLPLHDGPDFVSTQNIGEGCFVPHHVYNRERYIERITSRGYTLIDLWETPERQYIVPGKPEKSFDHYSGLYFRRG